MTNAPTIARALGMRRTGAVFTGRCPFCDYPGGFTVQDRDGRTLVRCHVGCEQADVLNALRRAGLWAGEPDPHRTPVPARSVTRGAGAGARGYDAAAVVERLWRGTAPARSTLAECYLRSRSIRLPPPPDLRFAPRLRHGPTGTDWPGMVAAVRDVAGKLVALHRTYLRPDGSGKAPADPAKMTLGPVGGAAVRLSPPGPRLIVGEGIESTLSAMEGAGLPGWAALSAGGIRALILPPLPSAAVVTIAADRDPVGIGAARDAAARWHGEGRTVHIALPPPPFDDWNDAATAEAVAHA